jgi:hypothetical protein
MARPTQNTVDYFPHDCQHKQTMYILENRYGNDGYAFWFKLLEMIGSTPNHSIDLSNETTLEFLSAKTKLSCEICIDILNLLAKVDAICPELWKNKTVWSSQFVERVSGVYSKRKKELPRKPSFCYRNDSNSDVSGTENPQSKVNKIIYISDNETGTEITEKETPISGKIENYEMNIPEWSDAFGVVQFRPVELAAISELIKRNCLPEDARKARLSPGACFGKATNEHTCKLIMTERDLRIEKQKNPQEKKRGWAF